MSDKDTKNTRLLSLAGLCRRAGGVLAGTDAVITALRQNSRSLKAVITASDASERTMKQITDKAAFYGAGIIKTDIPSDSLGLSLGLRGGCAVIALNGKGPAALLIKEAEKLYGNAE